MDLDTARGVAATMAVVIVAANDGERVVTCE